MLADWVFAENLRPFLTTFDPFWGKMKPSLEETAFRVEDRS
jgi:hypothetical protein